MSDLGQILLRGRAFQVDRAQVARHADTWQVEIETECKVYDDENWELRLYHQGLRLEAQTPEELPGIVVSWRSRREPGYLHPEGGFLYVFGHHAVRDCTLSFGEYQGGRIQLRWEGLCDVFWDAEFTENVPFCCQCSAEVSNV